MGKKRFFDDRLKYLSFIQNTSEKKAISSKIYPYIADMSQNKSYLRILDAGTGDGTIKSNVIKAFHRYHPYTSLLITGKEISYEDLKNADEAFFTGTAVEITPIAIIDQSSISDGKRGPITTILQDKFLSIVSGQNSQYSNWLTYTS